MSSRASFGAPSTLRRWTTAFVRTDFGTCPAALRMAVSAIVKQAACAAAINCSGFVPFSSPNRDPQLQRLQHRVLHPDLAGEGPVPVSIRTVPDRIQRRRMTELLCPQRTRDFFLTYAEPFRQLQYGRLALQHLDQLGGQTLQTG